MAQSQYVSVNQALRDSGLLEEIKRNLSNPESLRAIQKKARELAGLLEQLGLELQRKENAQRFESHRSKLLSLTNNVATKASASLTAQLGESRKYRSNKRSGDKIAFLLKRIFVLEHTILDMMTNHMTETTEYAIYYSGKYSGTVARGTISAKDLYKSEYIGVNKEGDIILKRSVIHSKYFQVDMNEDGNAPKDLTKMEEYKEFARIAAQFISYINQQYNDLKSKSRRQHLGRILDKRHDGFRALNKSEGLSEALTTEMEQRYLRYMNQRGEAPISPLINMGHLTEAFENFLQNGQGQTMTLASYLSFLRASLNNDPWYITGDVNSTQVKSFLDNASSRQVASLNSIIELGRRLLQLVTKTTTTLKRIEGKKVENEVSINTKDADVKINDDIEQLILDMLNRLT